MATYYELNTMIGASDALTHLFYHTHEVGSTAVDNLGEE